MAAYDEIYRALTSAQERFSYFYVAAAGACVAYALARTEGSSPALWMLLAGAAVVAWGASFYVGTLQLQHRDSVIALNLQRQTILESIKEGAEGLPAKNERIKKIDEQAAKRKEASRRCGTWQLRLLFAGAVLYVVGHVWRLLA